MLATKEIILPKVYKIRLFANIPKQVKLPTEYAVHYVAKTPEVSGFVS